MARVEDLRFTKSWRSREDFPTYEDSEDQVREDLQCLFDELRDFLNRKLLPAVNTISAAEIETASGGSVEAALSGLRAALADTVLGQLPDGSVTAAKLAPSAGLRDVTAAVHLALDPNFRANRPSDTLCFGYAESLGLLFVQGTISLYAVELGNVGFHARYRYDDYLPRLGTLVPFAVCASAGEAVLSATVGSDMLLDLTVENVPEGTPMVRVAISGWYDCGGEGSA